MTVLITAACFSAYVEKHFKIDLPHNLQGTNVFWDFSKMGLEIQTIKHRSNSGEPAIKLVYREVQKRERDGNRNAS